MTTATKFYIKFYLIIILQVLHWRQGYGRDPGSPQPGHQGHLGHAAGHQLHPQDGRPQELPWAGTDRLPVLPGGERSAIWLLSRGSCKKRLSISLWVLPYRPKRPEWIFFVEHFRDLGTFCTGQKCLLDRQGQFCALILWFPVNPI